MANKKVSVSSTSLSMTLPISCQICLGKVSLVLAAYFVVMSCVFENRTRLFLEVNLLCGFLRLENPLSAPISMSSARIVWTCGFGLTHSARHAEHR